LAASCWEKFATETTEGTEKLEVSDRNSVVGSNLIILRQSFTSSVWSKREISLSSRLSVTVVVL